MIDKKEYYYAKQYHCGPEVVALLPAFSQFEAFGILLRLNAVERIKPRHNHPSLIIGSKA